MIEKDEQYKIIDDFLSIEEYENCWDYVQNVATYQAGEKDHHFSYKIGMVHELNTQYGETFKLFPKHIHGSKLQRAYINFYAPREISAFHTDSHDPDAYTMLYYPCPTYELDEGGETQLIINDEIFGVRSKTNRLLIFKSDIMHRATPFKTHQRYTVALKYTNHADTGY